MKGGEARMVPKAEPRSYYGRAVIKAPVWKPEIPWYFFAGGLGGASAALALAADVTGNAPLARRARLVALGGLGVSPALLVLDLGRPARFLNMLRVFKVTSPMSVGSWLLLLTGGAASAAAADDVSGRFPRVGAASRIAAAVLGLPLASYTGVLLGNTAVPVWHEARQELPFAFAASAGASAGAAAALVTPAAHAAPARRLTVIGAAIQAGAMKLMELRLGALGEPYRKGAAGRFARAAKVLTAGGALTVALGGARSRPAAAAGSGAVLAGAVCERWAVFEAGFASAADPRYTVGPQRERAAAREAVR